MTSLSEVYEEVGRESLRRLYLGTGLFVLGAVMVVIAIVIATTDALAGVGLGTYEARKLAGLLAGLGVPAVFVGIFTVLPATAYERATAAVGASIAVFGVALFWYAYPSRWYGATPDHITLPVVAVYFLGTITTFWALFTAVVNFKTRNDPGGTVTLQRIVNGETRYVEVPASAITEIDRRPASGSAGSGVGVLGDVDRAPVMAPDVDDDDADVERTAGDDTSLTASDGGTTTGTARPRSRPDRYCGTCTYFDYVPGEEGMQPYCGFHESVMSDMDPCDQWEPNAGR